MTNPAMTEKARGIGRDATPSEQEKMKGKKKGAAGAAPWVG
jgi:hypothetical protein